MFQFGQERFIAGLKQSYTMKTRIRIPQPWERFVSQAGSIPNLKSEAFCGVCWNTEPDCRFDYLASVEVAGPNNLPKEFVSMKLDARRYAVFAHTGHVSAIPKIIDTIWTNGVPDSGLEIDKAPCFERYTSEFKPDTGMGGMEIWIPLAD